jgi:protein-S-isoprenylcysteine O-methyltransferase Ste14
LRHFGAGCNGKRDILSRPEEKMAETDTPGVIAPPPLIAVATLALGLLLDWLLPIGVLHRLGLPARLVLGALSMIAGAGLALVAERTFHRIGTNAPPWKPALALATTGIYARMRNPMYVGLALLVAGLAIALASDWSLGLLVPMALVLHYGVVLREERYLEHKFGEAYRRLKADVPRYGWRR